MPDWVGKDQPMSNIKNNILQMREISRAVDKKLLGNNSSKKKQDIVDEYGPYFIYGSGTTLDSHTHLPLNIKGCVANGIEEATAQRIWDKMYDFAKYALTYIF